MYSTWLLAQRKSSDLLGLMGVKGQVVVSAPHCQVLDLVPVDLLIILSGKVYHCGIVYKLD